MGDALVVWQLSDGKRGHERQVEGLIAALAARRQLSHHRIAVPGSAWRRLCVAAGGHFDGTTGLPAPHFIIGAGRACQWPLIGLRRARGGRSIYLMRPALPAACFDLCIIPRHDGITGGAHVLLSDGPLNPMRPGLAPRAALGLILIGGPSRHHRFEPAAVLDQVRRIVEHAPQLAWTVADSRRTPPDFVGALAGLSGVRHVRHQSSGEDWLPAALAQATQVWVSADSAGMLYEALSAAAPLGVIEVAPRRADRITAIAPELCARGLAVRVADLATGARPTARAALDEAGRIADALLVRWPQARP